MLFCSRILLCALFLATCIASNAQAGTWGATVSFDLTKTIVTYDNGVFAESGFDLTGYDTEADEPSRGLGIEVKRELGERTYVVCHTFLSYAGPFYMAGKREVDGKTEYFNSDLRMWLGAGHLGIEHRKPVGKMYIGLAAGVGVVSAAYRNDGEGLSRAGVDSGLSLWNRISIGAQIGTATDAGLSLTYWTGELADAGTSLRNFSVSLFVEAW